LGLLAAGVGSNRVSTGAAADAAAVTAGRHAGVAGMVAGSSVATSRRLICPPRARRCAGGRPPCPSLATGVGISRTTVSGRLPATRLVSARPVFVGLCQSRASGVGNRGVGSRPLESGAGGVGEQEDPFAAVGGADVARA